MYLLVNITNIYQAKEYASLIHILEYTMRNIMI